MSTLRGVRAGHESEEEEEEEKEGQEEQEVRGRGWSRRTIRIDPVHDERARELCDNAPDT